MFHLGTRNIEVREQPDVLRCRLEFPNLDMHLDF
jgi:hypothetical protein